MTSGLSEEQKDLRELFLRGQEQQVLSEWELAFLQSIFNQFCWKASDQLSVKQLRVLDRLFSKMMTQKSP